MTEKKRFYYCMVPMCVSTSHKTPNKIFVRVPDDPEKRRSWLAAARRDSNVSTNTVLHVCEDHFDLRNDMENYQEFIMSHVRKIMKKNIVPHKFDCQLDGKLEISSTERLFSGKRKRFNMVQQILNQTSSTAIAGTASENVEKLYNAAPQLECIYLKHENEVKETSNLHEVSMENTLQDIAQVTIKMEYEPWCYDDSDFMTGDFETCDINSKPTPLQDTNEIVSYCKDTVQTEPRDSCTVHTEADIVIKEEIKLEKDEQCNPESEYILESSNQFDKKDCNKPITEPHERVFHNPENVVSSSSETYIQKPEAIYIKEEVTDDCVSKANLDSTDKYNKGTGESHVCRQCGSEFLTRLQLRQHLRSHRKRVAHAHRCQQCGKSFRKPVELHQHILRHAGMKPLSCPDCEERFRYHSALTRHRHTHTIGKQHACPVCHKCFLVASELNAHIPVHTGERKYVCNLCSKAFKHSSSLRRHKFTHDGGISKPYKCNTCNRGFLSPSQLRAHHVMHTDERPHACAQCDSTFKTRSWLLRHRCANSANMFPCDKCERMFKTRETLRRHKRLHTGEKRYTCAKCDRQFLHSSSYSKHKKTHIWHYYAL